MRKLMLIAFLAAAPSIWAVGLQPCPTASLSSYLGNGFACIVDDKIFSDFAYPQIEIPNTTNVNPDLIVVLPRTGLQNNPIDPLNPGPGLIFFSSAWFAFPGQLVDSAILFNVRIDTENFPGMRIKDATLGIVGETHGTAAIFVTETVCPSGGVCQVLSATAASPFHTVAFDPTLAVAVRKDIAVAADARDLESSASLSLVFQFFSQVNEVPEPGTWMMLGTGLVGLGALRRRIRS